MDSYEQKYKEALENARQEYNTTENVERKQWLEELFPELAESEDERIKEAIIATIHLYYGEPLEDEAKEMIAWLEKQGKQKGYTFKSIPRLLDMIEPSDKANAYCQKLIDALAKEGYNTDAKIVEEVLKGWNGEDVPMAIMDEQKPVFEMKTPEESLGIDSDTYNKIVDECIYGEQNPADKLEPKFHKGEWIVWKDKCYKVNYNGCGYELVDQDGLSTSLEYGTIDENAHIWDVTTDAKDGDVLHSPNHRLIWIYKDIQYYHVCVNMNYVKENFSTDGFIVIPTDVCPATKDEQTILSVRIKESGYEWDAEKKELKKINSYCQENCKGFQEIGKCFADGECKAKREAEQEPTDDEMKTLLRTEYEKGRADAIAEIQNPVDCIDCTNSKGCINCEDGNMKETLVQKTAWGEEDEEILRWLCIFLNLYGHEFYEGNEENVIDWLKSLKDRVQPKQEWSEDDETHINGIIDYLCDYKLSVNEEDMNVANGVQEEIDWLKSLRPQNIVGYNPYKEVVDSIAEMCKHYDKASHSGLRDFYDNVKVKCKDAKEYDSLYPQNHWKPSGEQMQALKGVQEGIFRLRILESLYNDLKKLKQ